MNNNGPLHQDFVPHVARISKLMKTKAVKADRVPAVNQEDMEPLRSAQLQGGDLKDGLRMLILQEGKFWPARLNSTKLPDVYGVTMERQRGNRGRLTETENGRERDTLR